MTRSVVSLLLPLVFAVPAPGSERTALRCGRLIDGRAGAPLEAAVIVVAAGRIQQVTRDAPADATLIDLSSATCLPGLIDGHTHVLLQGDITAADYDEQLLKQSIAYRAIQATVAARTALLNGFTTIRDLETEGAMYADVDVKTAIERGVIPGPRMFVATRALAPTGMYGLLGYSWELKVPEGVQIVDGADALRHAVREQVKYGADWIKYYSDRRYNVRDGVLHSWVNYSDEEARALVDEAHRLGRKVAAHAMGRDGIEAALKAGVDTIEHGYGLDDALAELMAKRGVYWCPTLFVGTYVAEGRAAAGAPIWKEMVGFARDAFGRGLRKGVKIAYGTDAGGYPWTEPEARELSFMVRYGMTPLAAIRSATAVAAEMLGRASDLGTIEPGKLADVIAVAGDPLAEVSELERVRFVMKDGVVVKRD